MRRATAFALLLAAACGDAEQVSEAPEPRVVASAEPTSTIAPTQGKTERVFCSGPLVFDPPTQAEKGEQGARDLLDAWKRSMEDEPTRICAYALFGEYAERTGMTEAEYLAEFADYKTVNVAIGEGAVEGACGSSSYEVPVTLTGTTASGATYIREGAITLRRVNDVDGATPAQLKWHLEKLEWTE